MTCPAHASTSSRGRTPGGVCGADQGEPAPLRSESHCQGRRLAALQSVGAGSYSTLPPPPPIPDFMGATLCSQGEGTVGERRESREKRRESESEKRERREESEKTERGRRLRRTRARAWASVI
eukprot:294768-Rhodomonas_salina.1